MSDQPQSDPPQPAKTERPNARGVLCVKCEHLNPIDLDDCETCKAHLYVNCLECGAKNPRVGSRCVQCGRRLHKSKRGSSRDRRPLSRGWTLGIVLGIVLAIVLVVVLAGDNLPRLW
jgi:ribosomal protein L40E